MAITNTITSVEKILFERENVKSKGWEYLQTTGSGSTAGVLRVIGSATASDSFIIMNLLVSPTNPTATSFLTIAQGPNTLAILPTASTTPVNFNFGPYGLLCGTTTTATVDLIITTSTQTAYFYCSGFRKL